MYCGVNPLSPRRDLAILVADQVQGPSAQCDRVRSSIGQSALSARRERNRDEEPLAGPCDEQRDARAAFGLGSGDGRRQIAWRLNRVSGHLPGRSWPTNDFAP